MEKNIVLVSIGIFPAFFLCIFGFCCRLLLIFILCNTKQFTKFTVQFTSDHMVYFLECGSERTDCRHGTRLGAWMLEPTIPYQVTKRHNVPLRMPQ
jgi:hypothetical protein